MMNLHDLLEAWRTISAKRRAATERRAVAKAFNDLYCYRAEYAPRGGGRIGNFCWMCPDCNGIHKSSTCSAWSGLQYPACCTTGEGHRLSHGVRIK